MFFEKLKSYLFPQRPKKYHWYGIRYIYKKNGIKIFDFANEVGLVEQKTILNRRKIKKLAGPLYRVPNAKPLLCNGNLDMEILCYLGYFSKELLILG